MEEIKLNIDGHKFNVNKQMLCQHSDYFRAMFSGNYKENEQQEISIDVVDAQSMEIIIKYMEMGLIDLTEYNLQIIAELAIAANFLQITELIKQIEYTLDIQLSISNWLETKAIAENSSFTKLEQLSSAFGLLSFKLMKVDYIPSLSKLHWYLSHPYLNAENELEVFKFGFNWITKSQVGADALLVVIGCLDLEHITISDLKEIQTMLVEYENSLALNIIECLLDIMLNKNELSVTVLLQQKLRLCEKFSERVYNEVFNLVNESKHRLLTFTPSVPVWMIKDTKPEIIPHYMYTFTEKNGFEKWIEVAEKNLWGWNVISWGPTCLVVIGGEHGRGSGIFMKDVKVYDTLRKEWIRHGVELPPRRHGGVAICGDQLFAVGGVGGFRVVLDTAIIYDLKQRSYRKIAKFPDAIQNPAVCVHQEKIYGAGHKNIYRYEDLGETDRWTTVLNTDIRTSCMISYEGYIYCSQNYFSHLYRFRPDEDDKLDLINYFTNPPATICHLGNKLIVFTRTMCGQSDMLAVEEYTGQNLEERPRVLWSQSDSAMKVNDVSGSCTLVMSMPPLNPVASNYGRHYLKKYSEHSL